MPRAYFLIQAVAVAGWWLLLAAVPASRAWFLPSSILDPAFAAFAAPDLLVLSLASTIAGLRGGRAGAGRAWAWIAAGAAAYAAVYTMAWAILTHAPAASPILMTIAGLLSVHYARRIV